MTVLLLALAVVATVIAVLARRAGVRAHLSETRYRALASQWPDSAMALLDRELRVTLFEGAALEPDWQPGKIIGRRLSGLIPPDRYAEALPDLEAVLSGAHRTLEWTGLRSDDVFRVDLVPFREQGGDVTHVMLAFRNVSDQKALQHSLEEQSGFLSAVLHQLGERVTVTDAEGRIINFGGRRRDHRKDLHPLEWAEAFGLVHPDGRPFGPHEAPLLRALRGDKVRDVEMCVSTPKGTMTLLASGDQVTTADGRALGAVVVTADLTAFREAEGRLRRSEERHRRVVESMVDCVFEADQEGRWTFLSENWTSATGRSVEATLGRPSWEFVHPDDRVRHSNALAPLLAGAQTDACLEHRFLTVAGAERWAEVQVRAVSGWDGLPTGFVGVMRDVTDQQRARQHVAAERGVMRLLSAANGFDDIAQGLIEVLGAELGWDGAELWRMGDDERLLRAADWTAPGVSLERFMRSGATNRYEIGEGFPGQAWLSRVPLWKADIRGDESLMRLVEATAEGLCSTVALPLRAAGSPVGVVALVSRTPREPEPGLVRLLEGIGGHVTQFLQRRLAEGRAADQAEDLMALSRVARELAGETDTYAARLTLTRAVREVTAASSVVLWEPTDSGEELEVTAATGAALRGMKVSLGARSVISSVFHRGEFAFVPVIAGSPANASGWDGLTDAQSGAWVPVIGDDRPVGVLLVSWGEPRAVLPEREEELLRLLAAEAAITIHRTGLVAKLKSSARTDPLTGLPNRRVWDEDLHRELARARRHGGSLCLAMLDLDRFKAFNDHHGHQAGDQLLAATAAAWRPALRATDTVARYGGEEFALLLPHSDEEGAMRVVARLLESVPLGQTASAGVAVWDGAESAESLLARADAALYEAKRAGRARALLSPSAL